MLTLITYPIKTYVDHNRKQRYKALFLKVKVFRKKTIKHGSPTKTAALFSDTLVI